MLWRCSLGQTHERFVGAICWLTDDAHAAALTDEFFATVTVSGLAGCSNSITPWELFDVGAPEKKVMGEAGSKRGAQLKRSTVDLIRKFRHLHQS